MRAGSLGAYTQASAASSEERVAPAADEEAEERLTDALMLVRARSPLPLAPT